MLLTILLTIVMMAGLFLLLFGGVAFVQDPKFFSSAPKEVQAAIRPREERFPGAHLLGWAISILGILLMIGAVIFGATDGIRNEFSFPQFLVRFLIMLLGLELYDIIVFDWFLLCRSGFFPHYFPEVKPILGPHLFGYNWKSHLVIGVLCVLVSIVLSYFCTRL